jgi:multidrug efflux pump
MTSFACILGVLPLVVASGAGSEMRRALGTAVFSGMIGVTFFGIILTPVFYLVIARTSEWQVFRSGLLAKIGAILIDGLRLGPIRRSGGAAWRWAAAATKRRPKPALKAPPVKTTPAAATVTLSAHSAAKAAPVPQEALQSQSHE